MRIAMIIVRSLLGLLFLFASVTYFFKLITPPEPTGAMKVFSDGLKASVYLMPAAKVIELICALAFLSGKFVPLATVLIAPIIVNIVLINIFIPPGSLLLAAFLVLANAFIAYTYREAYKPLLKI